VVVERFAGKPRAEPGGKLRETGHRQQLGRPELRRPTPGAEHAHVRPVVDGLAGEENERHEVDEVRRQVAEGLALLGRVEEPGRPQVRGGPPPSS
jgi:hypothetical protein